MPPRNATAKSVAMQSEGATGRDFSKRSPAVSGAHLRCRVWSAGSNLELKSTWDKVLNGQVSPGKPHLPEQTCACFSPTTWKKSKPPRFGDGPATNYQRLERDFLWREDVPSFQLLVSRWLPAAPDGTGHGSAPAPR